MKIKCFFIEVFLLFICILNAYCGQKPVKISISHDGRKSIVEIDGEIHGNCARRFYIETSNKSLFPFNDLIKLSNVSFEYYAWSPDDRMVAISTAYGAAGRITDNRIYKVQNNEVTRIDLPDFNAYDHDPRFVSEMGKITNAGNFRPSYGGISKILKWINNSTIECLDGEEYLEYNSGEYIPHILLYKYDISVNGNKGILKNLKKLNIKVKSEKQLNLILGL